MTCRDCKFLNVKPDRAGRIRPRSDGAYKCTVPIPEPNLPACMGKLVREWPPMRSYMSPDDGAECTFHEKREKE